MGPDVSPDPVANPPHGRVAHFEPPAGAYLGVSLDWHNREAFNQAAGISHPAIYQGFTSSSGQGDVIGTLNRCAFRPDITPMVAWNIRFAGGAVTSGSLDAYLAEQTAAVSAFHRPVFLRPCWEMNGSWSPNYDLSGGVSPRQYRDSWRRVVSFFRTVPNVAFVWCPNVGRSNPQRRTPWDWYPGNDVVDWIGVDAYPDYATPVTDVVTRVDGLDAMASAATERRKPLTLAEWARGNAAGPPDTADAVNVVFDWAERWPDTVKALVYFNHAGSRFHQLEAFPVAADAFRTRAADRSRYLLDVVDV